MTRLRSVFGASSVGLLACFCGVSGGCLFPDYTFGKGGSGGASSSSSEMTSSNATGGTTNSSSSTSGGAGGTKPTENCFNGVDDNGDGLADCDDPSCKSKTQCAAPIPVGWGTYGYVFLAEGAQGAPATCPSYAPDSVYTGFDTLTNTEWICSDCGCDGATGQACQLGTDLNMGVAGFQGARVRDDVCGGNPLNFIDLTFPAPWDYSCISFGSEAPSGQSCSAGPCNTSIETSLPKVSGGSCAGKGGLKTVATGGPGWQVGITACGNFASLGGCSGGDKCVAKPPAAFTGSACVGKSGDIGCPSGFPNRHLYYGNFDDTRDCAKCECNDPVGGTCAITLTVYSDNSCTNQVVNVPSTCAAIPANDAVGSIKGVLAGPISGGTCTAVDIKSAPIGGVTEDATTATTFCCL